MARRREQEPAERIQDEIGRIDRSILLLVEARDRASARLHETSTELAPNRGRVDASRRASAMAWAAESGISDRLARRVTLWLEREGEIARGEAHASPVLATVTCILERPIVPSAPRPVMARPDGPVSRLH